MVQSREIYNRQDKEAAQDAIEEARAIEDHRDAQIARIIREATKTQPLASYALAYR